MNRLVIDCQPLSSADIITVARAGRQVELGPRAIDAMARSRAVIERMVDQGETVYGVTTGFGRLADRVIPTGELQELQRNLVMSHSVGTGESLPEDVVRAMVVLRVSALALGYSGIRPSTVQILVDLLNAGVVPYIPAKGSVGASGDLAPLAHLALLLIGDGEVIEHGRRVPAGPALAQAGIKSIELTAKEGLALINGTQLMTALGILLWEDSANALDVADIAGAISLEAVRGTSRPFDERLQRVRPHPGQVEVAAHLRELLFESEILASHRDDRHKVQDPYSLRCMPQVHGASRDAIDHLHNVMEIEINSATDNPLVFADDEQVISGGNFHGQPLALALDFAAIALAELADISERRVEAMLDPGFSELPPFLTQRCGVDSGFMVSQYTAAALVSENKILAHPASVDSIPTSANQEDHVSMGVTAGLKARDILRNVEVVLAIELLCACEGIDYRRPLRSGPKLEAVHALVRSEIPRLGPDRVLYPDIERATAMIRDGRVARAASNASLG